MLAKRRLDVSDYAALRGWDKTAQGGDLKLGNNRFLSESEMLEALGNGFNVCVFEAILWRILICHANHNMAGNEWHEPESEGKAQNNYSSDWQGPEQ